jgi:hypothetical protein
MISAIIFLALELSPLSIPFSGKIFAKPLFLVGFWLFRNISSHRMMSERSLCNPRYPIIKGLDMI